MSKHPKLISIKVRNGDINRALRKFKRAVNESAHLQELRERQTYTKPKTVRRKQKQQAIREQQKITIFEKIENGDNKLRLFSKKKRKKKSGPKPQNKNNSSQN